MFHEWFEVNYITSSNHEKVVEDFFEKNIMEQSISTNVSIVREKRKLCETTSEVDSITSKTEDSKKIDHTDELNKIEVGIINQNRLQYLFSLNLINITLPVC